MYGSNLVYNKLDSLNIQSELYAPEGMPHEYWGTYAGDWLEDGPNEYFNIIKDNAYSFIYDMLYPFQMEVVNDEDIKIESFELHQNYPNPFNPITSIRYDLPQDGFVNIYIYDMMGRVVKTLVNGSQTAGFKSVQWNATSDRNEPVSAGLYLYTIQAGELRQTKKMVLLK